MIGRRLVYIAGPISQGDAGHNFSQADRAHLELLKAGFAPFNPMFSMASTHKAEITWREWLEVDVEWMRKAASVLRLPGDSEGADLECKQALQYGIPCFESIETLAGFWRKIDTLKADDRHVMLHNAVRCCRQNGFVREVNL